jgi:DNA polymerase theta
MAHLSKDSQLCHLLSQPEIDVFKSIAATWHKKDLAEVTDTDRNAAKQICYGMLYGIGVKGFTETQFSSHGQKAKIIFIFSIKRATLCFRRRGLSFLIVIQICLSRHEG